MQREKEQLTDATADALSTINNTCGSSGSADFIPTSINWYLSKEYADYRKARFSGNAIKYIFLKI